MTLDLIIALACLLFSGCFSGFENGIIAIRKARLDHAVAQGSGSAILIRRFLDRPALMMGTILLGNNLVNSMTAIYFDKLAQNLAGPQMGTSIVAALGLAVVITFMLLVIGEITPKMWFRQRPLVRTQMLVYPMYGFYLISWPFVRAVAALGHALGRLFPGQQAHQEAARLREEFRIMLVESEEARLLDGEARRLLDNALSYTHRTVGQSLTPVEQVRTVKADATLSEAVALAEREGVSRLPVCQAGGKGDTWIGVFSVYDALYGVPQERWGDERVLGHLRPLVTIAERAGIDQVLPKISHHHAPLLAVLDRQGKPRGVITAEDVIQPLFGELNGA